MTRVLVTGGRGFLGSEVIAQLNRLNYTVRVMSRSPKPANVREEWAQADLETQIGLAEAIQNVDVIVNAASSTRDPRKYQQVDVVGTQKLLEHARNAGVANFIHVSIVGIDRIPFTYYRYKLAAEEVIKQSDVPWTIVRETQFYYFIDILLRVAMRFPIAFLPLDFRSQPMDVSEAAVRLVEAVAQPPGGMQPDVGGPEVLTADEMARAWLAARKRRCLLIPLPLPGKVAAGFRRGDNTVPGNRYGKITWAQWLQRTYGADPASLPREQPARA